jgi:hypothetical protein
MDYRIEIEETETGFSAYSPDVPGVGVAADSRDEAERLLHEAIAFQREPDMVGMGDVLQFFAVEPHGANDFYRISATSVNTSGTVPLPRDLFYLSSGSRSVPMETARKSE